MAWECLTPERGTRPFYSLRFSLQPGTCGKLAKQQMLQKSVLGSKPAATRGRSPTYYPLSRPEYVIKCNLKTTPAINSCTWLRQQRTELGFTKSRSFTFWARSFRHVQRYWCTDASWNRHEWVRAKKLRLYP